MADQSPLHPWGRGILWWLALAAAWLLLAAKISPDNLIAAAVTAVIGASVAAIVRRHGLALLRWPAGWPSAAARVPGQILRDTVKVFAAIGRLRLPAPHAVQGHVQDVSFDPGGDDPASRARRALTVLFICLSPNTIVTEVDRERGLLRVHHLVPTPPSQKDKQWPT